MRISFWLGVVIDGVVAVQLLLPEFWVSFNGLTVYTSNATLNFALVMGSALMWGGLDC